MNSYIIEVNNPNLQYLEYLLLLHINHTLQRQINSKTTSMTTDCSQADDLFKPLVDDMIHSILQSMNKTKPQGRDTDTNASEEPTDSAQIAQQEKIATQLYDIRKRSSEIENMMAKRAQPLEIDSDIGQGSPANAQLDDDFTNGLDKPETTTEVKELSLFKLDANQIDDITYALDKPEITTEIRHYF